ncbi:probable TGL4 Triacylglycerol lipase involved in TAG mobilization [Phialocephala subalpina]|uniref:Patatin-like phospholipase domain-containing protein n=1 Tax=Phialocephala subalpina TaxID=576137 RepID=A0A1L7WSM3_9HELO|nr:probable TGL4 Triacylglycerol lipase involved in TAG mobilization [Phialocephala subalpina]
MVLLEYLQKTGTPLLCVDNSSPRQPQKQLPSSAPVRGYICDPSSSLRGRRWSLLGPAVRILRGGVEVVNNTVLGLRDGLSEEQRGEQRKKEERRQILNLRMKNADSLEAWQTAAKKLDVLEDNERWKFEIQSEEFDAKMIQSRLEQMDAARINCDIKLMLNLVRTSLSRDLGGMEDVRLYKHSHIGTKDLIERYIDSTLATIRDLVEKSQYSLPDGMETKDILEQVVYARQAFGRSALLLSGGATFGMNHIGVLKALFEAHLLPRIISGASAGSIVCAVVCTRTDEEIPDVLRKFPFGNLAVFEEVDNEDGILERLRRLLTQGAWIDSKHLTKVMQEILGDMTFQEAYNRTRRILNICVSSASVYELPRLLNYITAPNVMIWSAVAASCSVPLLFSAAPLLVKNPVTGENTPWNPTPQRWIDGSVDNDLPMTRLAEMFNVNHFIVSQVNPHVVPFLVKDEEAITKDANSDGAGPGWVYTLTNLAKDEALHRMHVLAELGIFPNLVTKCRSVLSQKYSGDITILPEIEFKDFPRILKNPTSDFMVQACLCGERATWPKLSRIRNHCAVELELDAAVQKLRARVVFSPSQVDLRRMSTLNTTTKRVGRKRRDSVNLSKMPQFDGAEDNSPKTRKSLSRPPLRTSSTYWHGTRRLLPPHTKPGARTVQSTPLPTPEPGDSHSFKFQPFIPTPNLHLAIPDISSAGETTTTLSPPTSDGDADIDSHTDESSPESEREVGDMPSPGLYYRSRETDGGSDEMLDFFSSSQPVTSGTDHVLATSPLSSRPNIGLALTRLEVPKGSKTEPSSPEVRYKRLFHPKESSNPFPKDAFMPKGGWPKGAS